MRNQGTDWCVFDEASSFIKKVATCSLLGGQTDWSLAYNVSSPIWSGLPSYDLTQPSLALLIDPISYWDIYI